MSDRYAPPGFIWQCQACGKTSEHDAYGIEGNHSRGWDESCTLNSALIPAPVPQRGDTALAGSPPSDKAESAPQKGVDGALNRLGHRNEALDYLRLNHLGGVAGGASNRL